MATKFYTIKGKILWAMNLFQADKNPYNDKFYYRANLEVDDENFEIFKSTGIKTKVQEEDGTRIIRLKREQEPRTMPNGSRLGGGVPHVVDSNDYDWGESGIIGNGSLVEVTVAVYDTRAGVGHRLEKVKVLNHVKYDAPAAEETPSVEEETKKVPF